MPCQVTQVFQIWDFSENLHKACVKHLSYKLYYQQLHLSYLCKLARHWLQAPWEWHNSVITCRSVIICEIIVHLLVTEQNKKKLLLFIRKHNGKHKVNITYKEFMWTLCCYKSLPLTLILSQMNPDYANFIACTSVLISSTCLCLGPPCGLFPSHSLTKTLVTFLLPAIHDTCPTHCILLN
jgi:hypothetical protein